MTKAIAAANADFFNGMGFWPYMCLRNQLSIA